MNIIKLINIPSLVTIILSTTLSIFLSSCGSNMESASSVEPMFNSPLTLSEKMNTVCSKISSDPNLSLDGLGLGSELCSTTPGEQYIDLSNLTENSNVTSKEGGDTIGDKEDEKIYSFWTRTELYINNTILEAAQKASHTLSDLTSGNSSSTKFHISMIDKVKIDEENISVTASFNISSSSSENGTANISNNWNLYGVKVDNYIIASVQTKESEKNSEKSVVESGKIFIVVIPHAGDVYVDLFTQFNLHFSGTNAIMRTEIVKMLNQTLYEIKQTLS